MMEPDQSVSYDEVPWYRRTWFLVTMIFLFWPIAFIVAATGDFYQKANRRSLRKSNAEVWRSTGSGRVVMALCGVLLTALYGGQIIAAISELVEQDDPPSSNAVAAESDEFAEPKPELQAGSTATPSPDPDDDAAGEEASGEQASGEEEITEEAPPADPELEAIDRRLADVYDEAVAIAEATLGTDDMTAALTAAYGDDRYDDLQLPPDVQLDTLTLGREDDGGDDRPTSVISATFASSLDIDTAVAALATIAADRGHVEEERVDETDDDGVRTITLEQEPRPDGPLQFEGLTFSVTTADAGVSIRVFRYLVDDEPLGPSALLERALPAFPVPVGYEATGAEIRLRTTSIEGPDIELRVLGPEPDMSTDEVFDAIIQSAAPLWVNEDISSPTLRKLVSGSRAVYVGVSPTSRQTIIRLSIS